MPTGLSRVIGLATLALILLMGGVEGHGKLVKPWSRRDGMDEKGVMGCPAGNDPKDVPEYKPGESIDVRYHRNNHIGGFIRWSIIKKDEEKDDEKESKAFFDDHAFFFTCRESGPDCVPKENPTDMMSGDGTDEPNTLECGDKITLPDWLDEGEYVLQWTWFGVGHHNGAAGVAENQFRSCADIKLTAKGTGTKPKCPKFVGGDRMTKAKGLPNDRCLFFHINDIITNETPFESADKGSDDDYRWGIPAVVDKCGEVTMAPAPAGAKAPLPPTTAPSTAPTPPPTNATATTAPPPPPPPTTAATGATPASPPPSQPTTAPLTAPGGPTNAAGGNNKVLPPNLQPTTIAGKQMIVLTLEEAKALLGVPAPGTVTAATGAAPGPGPVPAAPVPNPGIAPDVRAVAPPQTPPPIAPGPAVVKK